MKKLLLLGFTFTGILAGCQDLRYGQIDCATLQGEAARLCQDYRFKKAEADIREKTAALIEDYRRCLQMKDADCSGYAMAMGTMEFTLGRSGISGTK